MTQSDMTSHHGEEIPLKTDGKYPNETVRLLHERGSCRSFHERKIPPGVLDLVLEAGIHAPTGGNLQPYSIIKIESEEAKGALAEMCGQAFIRNAPVDLLFCLDWRRLGRWAALEDAPFSATSSFRHFWISFQDTVICAQNISTAADAMGLGSVYVGTVIDFIAEIRDIFKLPEKVFPVVLLSLGYPAGPPAIRKKMGIGEIVHAEVYRDTDDSDLLETFREKYPEVKIPITGERLEVIAEVCKAVNGEEFAENLIASIKRNGYINAAQRYFGLHYRADMMPRENDNFLRLMEESGFEWFKEYAPPGESE